MKAFSVCYKRWCPFIALCLPWIFCVFFSAKSYDAWKVFQEVDRGEEISIDSVKKFIEAGTYETKFPAWYLAEKRQFQNGRNQGRTVIILWPEHCIEESLRRSVMEGKQRFQNEIDTIEGGHSMPTEPFRELREEKHVKSGIGFI